MSGSETNKKSHPLVAKVICSSAPRIPTCIAACGLPSYSCERALPTYGWDVDVACTKISNRELGTNAAGPRGLYPYLPLRGRAYRRGEIAMILRSVSVSCPVRLGPRSAPWHKL